MPLNRLQQLNASTYLGIWRISESVEELKRLQNLTIPEEMFFAGLKNELRKKHWLSYRLILKSIPGVVGPISYDEFGKPSLPVSGHFVSVSHSGDFSVLMASRDSEVGTDIERIRDRIGRVKERFLSAGELQDLGTGKDQLRKLYVCWGIKETIYKIYGKPEIEFSQDILIPQFDYVSPGECDTLLLLDGQQTTFRMHYEELEDYMLVYAWKKINE